MSRMTRRYNRSEGAPPSRDVKVNKSPIVLKLYKLVIFDSSR
jgi:hypothetical protein